MGKSRAIRSARPQAGRFILVLLLGLSATWSGCLSRPTLQQQTFDFVTPTAKATVPPNTKGPVLEVRSVSVSAPFDSQTFIYRTGDYSFERDPYAQFLVPPGEGLVPVLEAEFRNSGLFRRVVGPDSLTTPDLELEGKVEKLYGDFRNRQSPTAFLAMRFVVYRSGKGGERSFLDKEYSRQVSLSQRTAAAVAAGWNDALRQITTAALADLRGSLNTNTKGGH